MATSAELSSLLEHETVAPERSVDVLVVIVEVSGDCDMRLNSYIPVSLVACCFAPIWSVDSYNTLSMSSESLKKSISHCRIVDSVTVQVKIASDSVQTSSLRIGVPNI